MLQKFSCGHTTTCGFWKDDDWFETKGLCPLCKQKDHLKPTTKMVRKDDKVLILKLARVTLK